ncbi:uncharacterized protein [Hoplias malabaricus]|uniref:uncharacterized protein n=1 Tax=Hoplias malabaricus TaxID=27720 RepID=UPI003462FF2F
MLENWYSLEHCIKLAHLQGWSISILYLQGGPTSVYGVKCNLCFLLSTFSAIGESAFLVLAVTGLSSRDEATFSHVTLLVNNGESLNKVLRYSSSSGRFGGELVGHIDSVPRTPFSLRLSGEDGKRNRFERVSAEVVQPAHVQILVLSAPQLLSGHPSLVLFEVFNHGPERPFTFTAEDDCGYLSDTSRYRRFSIEQRGSARREVELKTPQSTPAGQTVTLTLSVQAQDSLDSNYAVVHLTVLPETRPFCTRAVLERNQDLFLLKDRRTSLWIFSLAPVVQEFLSSTVLPLVYQE